MLEESVAGSSFKTLAQGHQQSSAIGELSVFPALQDVNIGFSAESPEESLPK